MADALQNSLFLEHDGEVLAVLKPDTYDELCSIALAWLRPGEARVPTLDDDGEDAVKPDAVFFQFRLPDERAMISRPFPLLAVDEVAQDAPAAEPKLARLHPSLFAALRSGMHLLVTFTGNEDTDNSIASPDTEMLDDTESNAQEKASNDDADDAASDISLRLACGCGLVHRGHVPDANAILQRCADTVNKLKRSAPTITRDLCLKRPRVHNRSTSGSPVRSNHDDAESDAGSADDDASVVSESTQKAAATLTYGLLDDGIRRCLDCSWEVVAGNCYHCHAPYAHDPDTKGEHKPCPACNGPVEDMLNDNPEAPHPCETQSQRCVRRCVSCGWNCCDDGATDCSDCESQYSNCSAEDCDPNCDCRQVAQRVDIEVGNLSFVDDNDDDDHLYPDSSDADDDASSVDSLGSCPACGYDKYNSNSDSDSEGDGGSDSEALHRGWRAGASIIPEFRGDGVVEDDDDDDIHVKDENDGGDRDNVDAAPGEEREATVAEEPSATCLTRKDAKTAARLAYERCTDDCYHAERQAYDAEMACWQRATDLRAAGDQQGYDRESAVRMRLRSEKRELCSRNTDLLNTHRAYRGALSARQPDMPPIPKSFAENEADYLKNKHNTE